MVGSVKKCLRKIPKMPNARLSFDELLTVLSEVEATLNSRPVAYDYDSPGEEVLTPAHLIYGRRLTSSYLNHLMFKTILVAIGGTGTSMKGCSIFERGGAESIWQIWERVTIVTLKRQWRSPGGTPYNGLYGVAPPERGTFFRLQVYKRVGISQV